MNRLTEFGYYGGDADQLVAGAIAAAGGDRAVAEGSAIMFLDEIDKLRSYGSPNHREVGGATAQAALLDLVEGQLMTADMYDRGADGRSLRTTIQFDASGVWVVAAGAFSGLSAIVERRIRGPRRMGFSATAAKPIDAALRRADVLRETTVEDLVSYGRLPELCGRFLDIVVLDPLRASDYRAILGLKTADAPIRQWKRVAETLAFELRFTDGLLDALAAAAEAEGLGARSLRGLVGRACRRAMCEVPERVRSRPAYDVYARCTLDVAALEDGSYGLTWPRRTKRQAWAEPGWSDEVEGEAGAEEPESGTAAG
jgi:ATP-dependent Clp protease ATP-binding subunit ClpX